VDEISMAQEIFYRFFVYLNRVVPETKFVMAGDFAQLLPVRDRIADCCYKGSIALHELCDGQRLQLTKCRRSESVLFDMLQPDKIGEVRPEDFKRGFTDRRLTLTNRRRIEINARMMELYIKRKKRKPKTFEKLPYDKNSQRMDLLPGMPVISRRNNKDSGVCNNELFVIKTITDEIITIKDEERKIEVPTADFHRSFYVAFAMTICKSQGSTFHHEYTIHEWSRLGPRNKYVALSRASSRSLINIAPT